MTHWLVLSPEMSYVDVILDDGTGPTEIYRDVAWVEADDMREAVRIGTPLLAEWVREQRENDANPFTGVKAEDARCPHGVCFCELDGCDGGPNATWLDDEARYTCVVCERETDLGVSA